MWAYLRLRIWPPPLLHQLNRTLNPREGATKVFINSPKIFCIKFILSKFVKTKTAFGPTFFGSNLCFTKKFWQNFLFQFFDQILLFHQVILFLIFLTKITFFSQPIFHDRLDQIFRWQKYFWTKMLWTKICLEFFSSFLFD